MLMWLREFCIRIGGTWATDYPCYPLLAPSLASKMTEGS